MRFLKIILSVFALFYRLTPNYLIISDVYFLHRQIIDYRYIRLSTTNYLKAIRLGGFLHFNT